LARWGGSEGLAFALTQNLNVVILSEAKDLLFNFQSSSFGRLAPLASCAVKGTAFRPSVTSPKKTGALAPAAIPLLRLGWWPTEANLREAEVDWIRAKAGFDPVILV